MAAPVRVDGFLLGAPKCGTTWLAQALEGHPDVCVSNPKEPNELATHRGTFARLPRDPNWTRYEECFQCAGFRVDASVHAFADPDAPRSWAGWYPTAKFIICLRQPVERAVSHWNMIVNTELDRTYRVDWSDFRTAWKDVRLHAESLYGRSIARWLQHFDLDQFLLLDASYLQTAPQAAYTDVLTFLGLAADQLDAHRLQPVHEGRSKRVLTGFGRVTESVLPGRVRSSVRATLAPYKHRLPLVTRKTSMGSCTPEHHAICAPQVMPDLLELERLTAFPTESWRRDTARSTDAVPANLLP